MNILNLNNRVRVWQSIGVSNSASSYDADAQAFITAVGTLDTSQEVAINNLVLGLKANGTWSKYHAIYPMIGGTASSHKWNLKDPRDLDVAFRLSFFNTIIHSATGILSAGTGYANTFYIPSIDSVTANASMSFYSRTDTLSNGVDMGSFNPTRFSLECYWAGSASFDCYGISNERVTATNTDPTGYYVGSRQNTSDSRIYRNGSQIGTTQTSVTATSPPSDSIFLLCVNNGGPVNYSYKEMAFATIGLSLTPTEVANDYTVIQTYQTALGRQV